MPHIARWITKSFLLGSFLALSACALFDDQPPQPNEEVVPRASRQRIFFASFDQVWRAAHTVLKYPLATENPDTGTIETEYVKSIDGWRGPDENQPTSASTRYKLILTLAKGRTNNQESTRVTIEKRIELLKDFFSNPRTQASDGIEESVLFYRLERELVIENALKKAN